ncbi:MAG: DUF2399 domain-containing protein [Syntrophomonadaceae bacterium]|nr:DUF2399 domain-containing protein [Syntrophomonadaceae bacterium]
MDTLLITALRKIRRKQISLGELEGLVAGETPYDEFAGLIGDLVEQGVLVAVKSHGCNGKPIPLANTYRIIHSNIPADHLTAIEHLHFTMHPLIKLEPYYRLGSAEWEHDLPYLLKIDQYLHKDGLPAEEAAVPERSYQLVGDEKWIDEKGGKKLLDRTGLWPLLKIISLPDPLMLGINPRSMSEDRHLHLAVENKTTFHALLDHLPDTEFLSLIYGAGWKISAGIIMLDKQLGLTPRNSTIYYFGDLDYEGISIWHALNSRRPSLPAVPFYSALLTKPVARGKETQICNEEAVEDFLSHFMAVEQEKILDILGTGRYYPQEGLNSSELGDIWRNSSWK